MKSNSSISKITDSHRAKLAYVYIRQSTIHQVLHNRESTVRQYELSERAVALGWPSAHVYTIDDDLAKSGSSSELRQGFQQLLAEISLGRVGLVISLEAARLARNCSDWYHMLELCSIFGTLIADYEIVYDPRLYHDRLLLGLVGMMSEAELHHIRMRMHEGRRHKAERGELELPLPVGLERLRTGEIVFNPDEEIQARIRLIFDKFNELGSARWVVQYLREHQLRVPARPRYGPSPFDIVWMPAKVGSVLNILQNPAYAGAYVYGRTKTDLTRRKAGACQGGIVTVPMEEWEVCLKDRYPAYISWQEFVTIQHRLRANQYVFKQGQQGAPRTGQALLQGIAMCGKCGARLWTRYRGARGQYPSYVCNESARELGESRCQDISSIEVDAEVASQILQALEPDKIALALATFAQLKQEDTMLERQWKLRIERAEYEAMRAQRQYDAVDPDNRLVARNLEKHWEKKLREAEKISREYQDWSQQRSNAISPQAEGELLALAENLPKIWYASTTTNADRKRIVRLVIKDVIIDRKRQPGQVWVQINWQTGAITQQSIAYRILRYAEVAQTNILRQRLRELKEGGKRDRDIVRILRAEGYQALKGGEINHNTIFNMRQMWQIDSPKQARKKVFERWDDGSYTMQGVVSVIGVNIRTVYWWIKRGMLDAHQPFKHSPWKIVLSEEKIAELKEYVARVRILPKSQRGNQRGVYKTDGDQLK